ncbi:MAG: MlaE family ABC transporter permease [Sandaracinaceae bacterium]
MCRRQKRARRAPVAPPWYVQTVSEAAAEPEEPGEESPPPKPEVGWGEAVRTVAKSAADPAVNGVAELGILAHLIYSTVRWGLRPPYRFRLLVEQLEFIGVQSIFIVGLTGTFVGAVFGLQLVDGFRQFGAENQAGAVVGIALVRELAPVFSALMITSRAGSAMATEIASMRVTNQIDALTTMSVNPIQYLIVPRVLAGLIAAPMMALLFFLVGLFGAYTVGVFLMGIDGGIFIERVKWFVDVGDVEQGLVKAAVFGTALTLIACRHGFYAEGGAAGVGRATNRAVVQAAVAILVLDYIVTGIILGQGLA